MCQTIFLNALIILLIINFIILISAVTKGIYKHNHKHSCHKHRVKFSVNGYEDELNFYKSLSPLEQKEYLTLTKEEKIKKYYQ